LCIDVVLGESMFRKKMELGRIWAACWILALLLLLTFAELYCTWLMFFGLNAWYYFPNCVYMPGGDTQRGSTLGCCRELEMDDALVVVHNLLLQQLSCFNIVNMLQQLSCFNIVTIILRTGVHLI
jgi:hypothetical protein